MPATRPRRRRDPRSQHGFSLLELLVSLFIAAQVLIAAAVAFDVHTKMARVQTQITDLQQALRIGQYDIVRMVRMAGRGSLPVALDPDAVYDPTDTIPALRGFAIEVRNNVTGDERFIARGDATSPQAIEGSDILTVRGCFGGTVYQVNPESWDGIDTDADGIADQALMPIPSTSDAGLSQPLAPLLDEIEAYDDEVIKGRLILTSKESLQTYGVANVLQVVDSGDPMMLRVGLATNSTLNPVNDETGVREFPEAMAPQLACLLEEYRFYVRTVAGDSVTPLRPRLSRARFEPGTEQPYLGDDENFALDIADGQFDLQVALGLDTDYCDGCDLGEGAFGDDEDNEGPDDLIYEADLTDADADGTIDDWLYNDPDDRPADAQFVLHANGLNAGNTVQTYFLRLTTAARTARPDRGYRAPDFDTRADGDWIEDHDYDSGAAAAWKTDENRLFRHRTLTTTIDMRNAQ